MAAGRPGSTVFLICTADERFWRFDGSVLLLGEWCRTYGNRATWARTPHEVLPYHWDDRAKLARDYEALDAFYERTLVTLTDTLNGIHGTSRSVRYWRLVLGPWWAMFLQVLFDRYESVRLAAADGRVTGTRAGEHTPTTWLPGDIRSFVRWVGDSDAYNQFLFARIAGHIGAFPVEYVPASEQPIPAWNPGRGVRRGLEGLLWRAAIRAPSRFAQVALVDSSLSPLDQMRLQLRLGQFPTTWAPDLPSAAPAYDPDLRAKLAPAIAAGNQFERLAGLTLAEQLPSAYLEHYSRMSAEAERRYPRAPRVIFTAVAFEAYEGFKMWAGASVDRGAKLAGTQHGCHYGTARFFDSEDHQRRIYDRFFSWGWTDDRQPPVVPLAAAKFNKAQRTVRPRADGGALLAPAIWPRYAYRLYSVPISATGSLAHLEDQFALAEALPVHIRSTLTVRVFPNDRGWNQRARWNERVPEVRIDPRDKSFLERLGDCRLLIAEATSTTMLESLAANYPTVLFWNPQMFELRDSAQPFYAALESAGVLHRTPEAAARKIASVWDDVAGWWTGPEVQAARAAFCERFTNASPGWRRQWARALSSLAAEAMPSQGGGETLAAGRMR